jgi:hypothetical protein
MAARVARPRLSFLRLRKVPIQEQLRIEEAIFRVDKQRNWFIFNEESAPTTIVMGISGKPEKLLHLDAVKRCVSEETQSTAYCVLTKFCFL